MKRVVLHKPDIVKRLRKDADLSMLDLAERAGTTAMTICRAERGDYVSLDILAALARELGTPVVTFLNQDGENKVRELTLCA